MLQLKKTSGLRDLHLEKEIIANSINQQMFTVVEYEVLGQ